MGKLEVKKIVFCFIWIKKVISFSSIIIGAVVFNYSDTAYADVNGIPYNSDFPEAQYPYAKAPNGCGPGLFTNDPREIRDTWGPVDFTGACNTHDKCYYTLGSNWNTCNERFYSDLRAACERDLRTSVRVPAPTLSDPLRTRRVDLPPDPVRLTSCYGIATSYYGGVQAGVAFDVFKDAQKLQRDYEQWVASLRNSASNNNRPPQRLLFGAIARSDSTRRYGFAYGFDNQQAAENRAIRECGTSDCKSSWFRNAFGALSVADDNAWASMWGNTREEAEQNSLQNCQRNSSQPTTCRVVLVIDSRSGVILQR